MQASSKPVPQSAREDKKTQVAPFKNSLRAWQARYKARLAALAPVSEKAASQAANT